MAKHAAIGSEAYAAARDQCSAVVLEAYRDYVGRTRDKLKTLGTGTRGWWKIANTLLTKAGSGENIPALQRSDGTWAMDPEERANELADTFRAKARLPPPVTNAYIALPEPAGTTQTGFLRIRTRSVLKIMRDLDEHSATGPDFMPARILKSRTCFTRHFACAEASPRIPLAFGMALALDLCIVQTEVPGRCE